MVSAPPNHPISKMVSNVSNVSNVLILKSTQSQKWFPMFPMFPMCLYWNPPNHKDGFQWPQTLSSSFQSKAFCNFTNLSDSKISNFYLFEFTWLNAVVSYILHPKMMLTSNMAKSRGQKKFKVKYWFSILWLKICGCGGGMKPLPNWLHG